MSESIFAENFTGSGAANIASAFVFLLVWFIKNKCNKSSCKSHTKCCDCRIKDDDEGEGDLSAVSKLKKKLKSVCQKCNDSSVMVYLRNIKRLYKLTNEGVPPLTGDWLSGKKLEEKYAKLPLGTRRHLSIAAVKAAKMYKVKEAVLNKWTANMYKDSNQYENKRSENKRSSKESDLWPRGGWKSVKKAAKEQWKRVKLLLGKEPSMKVLYRYQLFIILKLFSEVPFRNNFADFSLKDDGKNNFILQPKKGKIKLVVRKHKAVKHLGPKEVTLSRANTMALRKFLKYREKVVDNEWFLNTMKKEKMSRATMGKAVHRVTSELIGKSFGSRLIRVLAATANKAEIEKVADLSNKLLHTTKQTKQYVKNWVRPQVPNKEEAE